MRTKLKIITGLHIGGSDDTMKIGGIDSSVVKREVFVNDDGSINYDGSGKKITEPYIPGSSLKGKIRSLLEHSFGLIKEQRILLGDKAGKPVDTSFADKLDGVLKEKAKLIIELFGESAGSKSKETKITRVIFRDSFLTKESRKLYLEDKISLSEEKAENTINRVAVTANPRFIERVPSGVEFDFEYVLRDFIDDEKRLKLYEKTLMLGLLLLQNDALGGGGSRGNGKIEFDCFDDIKIIEEEIKTKIQEIEKELIG